MRVMVAHCFCINIRMHGENVYSVTLIHRIQNYERKEKTTTAHILDVKTAKSSCTQNAHVLMDS